MNGALDSPCRLPLHKKLPCTIRKIVMKPYPWFRCDTFRILIVEDIDYFMQISCLSLRLHFYLLGYDRNIFESSMKVFGNLRRVILGNVRKRVCENAQTILWGIFRSLENVAGNLRKITKTSFSVCSHNKQNNTLKELEIFHIFVCIILSVTCLS